MSASDHLPTSADIAGLASAAHACTGCELHRDAGQVVFSRGPEHARVVLVGEQPGDVEDQRGQPFVGPAGTLLDRALRDAGGDGDAVYVTNAVKHFRFRRSGTRRIHQTPDRDHIVACRPWLSAELALLNPEVVVALGATAVRSLLGDGYRVTRHRGTLLPLPIATNAEQLATHTTYALITTHPSAVLRASDEQRDDAYRALVADLSTVFTALAS